MKRITLLFLCVSTFATAQELKMYKTFSGAVYERDSTILSLNQTLMLLKDNEAAYKEMKKAKPNYSVSGVMGFSGIALVAFPTVTAIAGGKPEWTYAAGGAALLLGSFHFLNVYRGRAYHAIEIYNGKTTSRLRTDFQFYGTGAKLSIRF